MIVFALALDQAVSFGAEPVMPGGRALLTVAIVLALLGAAAWLLRRHAPARRTRLAVTVETAVSLGDRRSLVIVGVEGRRLLLGLTPGSVSLVTELGTSPFDGAQGDREPVERSFPDALRASIEAAPKPETAS
jgi:flagellar biosynthetic protein FliO